VFKYFWLVLTYAVLAVLAESGGPRPAPASVAGAEFERSLAEALT
jgi:hypothetical protein